MKSRENDNFMMYVPSIKHTDYVIKDGSVFLVFHHDKLIEKFLRWIVKKPYVSDIKLDDIGTFIWQNINGKNTVYEIGQIMKKNYGNKCEPLYERLTMYLGYLIKRGWVKVKMGESGA